MTPMTDRILFARVRGSVADIINAGIDLLPHFEMAAITVLESAEEPAEVPGIRRRLRAEGVRAGRHRGAILLLPGDLEHLASVGMLLGGDEIFLMAEWIEEFEPFPGRISGDACDFAEVTPLGLEEWMVDTQCIAALGDTRGVNFATFDVELDRKLRARFPAPKD
ncbi:MAG: hypothetical protein HOP12_02685 [Candidatus Eisenbacteria bacterium]|uniref:Uncharacterized protein n=1 Tax=Eiseniibacteriota bacterium TaxID=2212470 RepID=A0A849SF32_UNCEI|nr:hypothetical protein [Candidatus Eisenbacteria bacterium]